MLGKNEQLVKKWDYATTQDQGFFTKNKKQHSLMITNKRLIHEVKGSKTVSREEVGIKNIKSFNVFTYYGINWLGLLLIIASLPIIYLGLMSEEMLFVLVGVLLIVGGVLLLIFLKKKGFMLQVYTNGNTRSMNISLLKLGKILLNNKGFKIKLDMNQAKEISDTLGALIVTLQDQE